ncbi:hypothetical protein PO124_02965 [Bacillus licheniformis]|nr:hypothetical protein [Bacillus licheniformis]
MKRFDKEAMEFIGRLERHFGGRRRELLHLRTIRQAEIDQGKNPCFWRKRSTSARRTGQSRRSPGFGGPQG